ncbi:MAG TPA: ABC transporter permease [Acidimicrobiales bacterium]
MRRRAPAAVWPLAGLGLAFLALPLAGLLQRAPWASIADHLGDPAVREALRLSLVVSCTATVAALVLGVPLAWVLARATFPGRSLVRGLVLLPMVLPPVVGGLALLYALGRRGLAGQWLDRWLGVTLPFTTAGAVVAATFVALPFLVVTVEGGLRSLDPRYEDAAATLGAGRWTVLRRVTLPMVAPSLAAGAALAWARALGEFGATITFAGNAPGRTRTMPIEVYLLREGSDRGGAVALSLVMVAVSLAVLALLRDRWFPSTG